MSHIESFEGHGGGMPPDMLAGGGAGRTGNKRGPTKLEKLLAKRKAAKAAAKKKSKK